jgi:hypothetical protein
MNTFIGVLLSAEQGDGTLPLPLGHVPGQCILGHLGEVIPVDTPKAATLLAQDVAGSVLGDAAVTAMVAPQEIGHAPAHRDAHQYCIATSATFEAAFHCVRVPAHLNPR